MIISAIFILVLIVQQTKTVSQDRRILSLVALALYLVVSGLDLYWLECVENMSFHFSDPTQYYVKVQGLSFGQLFQIESSNTFYYIVNWIYDFTWSDTTLISFFVKINNALIAVCVYLLATRHLKKVNYLDYLLLFNPYTIMTFTRNVRDMYIVLFVLMILLAMGVIQGRKLGFGWCWLAIILLAITRSVLLGPLLVVYWMMHKELFSKRTRVLFYVFLAVMIFIFRGFIIMKAGQQMLSAIVYMGEFNENMEFMKPILKGNISTAIILYIIPRLFIGLMVFLFTPHPYNYISKWIENMSDTGSYGIYTGVDNFLISVGAVFNYIFVIPVIIAVVINYKKVNKYILVFVILYIILYVVSYLGSTDIRNRNTAIFFILLSVLFSRGEMKIKPIHYILSGCLFLGLMFLSS